MKLILIVALMSGLIYAQTIYKVTPGSSSNRILLTVENSSLESEISGVKARLVNQLSSIIFRDIEQNIGKISTLSSSEAEFNFNVNRIVDVNKVDTLNFLITSNSGSWQKEILIGYELPTEFKLEQNYPNPFNPSTNIEFSLPKEGKYSLRIYNILGQAVETLAEQKFEAGYHRISFDGKYLTSGIYFYSLSGEGLNTVKKMILMK